MSDNGQNMLSDTLATAGAHEEVFYQSAEFWVAAAFVICMALLLKPVLRALSGMITQRISRIRNELREAEDLKLEAQKLYAEYERKLLNAEAEVADIVNEEEKAIAEAKDAKMRELKAMLQRRTTEVDNRIEQAFEQANAEINQLVGTRTADILKSVISSKLTKSDYNRLIDDSINTIKGVTIAE